jgi:hypothetical protein
MNHDVFKDIVRVHELWLRQQPGHAQMVVKNEDLSGLVARGMMLFEADLTDVALDGAVLDGAVLAKASLTRVSLKGASLRGAEVTDWSVLECDLTGADLSGVNGTGGFMTRCRMAEVKCSGARFYKARFDGCDLQAAQFGGATLKKDDFDRCNLRRCDFRGALLYVSIWGCDLRETSFTGSQILDEKVDFVVGKGLVVSESKVHGTTGIDNWDLVRGSRNDFSEAGDGTDIRDGFVHDS